MILMSSIPELEVAHAIVFDMNAKDLCGLLSLFWGLESAMCWNVIGSHRITLRSSREWLACCMP